MSLKLLLCFGRISITRLKGIFIGVELSNDFDDCYFSENVSAECYFGLFVNTAKMYRWCVSF